MLRKWMTLVLAMLLAMMMPLCALADKQHTLSIIPGDELAAEPAVADLLDVLSFTLTLGDESGALTVSLAENDVLTAALSADVTGLYVHSNLLSDDVLYVTWDDGFAVMSQLATAEMDAASAEAFQQTMEQSKQSIISAMQTGIQTTTQIVTPEENMAAMEEMFKDDPGMVEYLKGIYEKLTVEEGEYADAARDTATGKQTLTMTNQDFMAIIDTNYMRTVLEEALVAEQPNLSAEELTQTVDAAVEEMRSLFSETDMNLNMIVYTVDDGLTPVGVELVMPMTMPAEEATVNGQTITEDLTVTMKVNYNRLTDGNGMSHKADLNMDFDGETAMEMLFDLYKGADGVSKGSLAMLADGEEITVLYNASNDGDVRTRRADLYLRSGASAIIVPSASDRPLIGFEVVSQPADPAVLSTIENANSSNSVNVMKLSDEEMTTLMTSIESRAMQILFNAMGSLPTSVLTLLMNTAQ